MIQKSNVLTPPPPSPLFFSFLTVWFIWWIRWFRRGTSASSALSSFYFIFFFFIFKYEKSKRQWNVALNTRLHSGETKNIKKRDNNRRRIDPPPPFFPFSCNLRVTVFFSFKCIFYFFFLPSFFSNRLVLLERRRDGRLDRCLILVAVTLKAIEDRLHNILCDSHSQVSLCHPLWLLITNMCEH